MTDRKEFRFDGFRLDTASGELVRDGRSQRLTSQPLRILVELLTHAGHVVPRERLVQLLWPKGIVDFDNGLNVAVRKLRVALGDDSDTPRYIETLPRVGYRFIGRVEVDVDAPGHTAATPLPVAPMPVEPVPVISVPATPRRRRTLIVTSLALAAAALVIGWWLWSDSRVDAPERPMTDAAGAEPPIVARRTTSVRAYEHYLQGIFHRSRRDVQGTDLAIASLEAALREDPDYPEAWAALAETYIGAAVSQLKPTRDMLSRAREAALEAVDLDPGVAEGHAALGQVYVFLDRDYAAAEAAFGRARALNDNYARLWHHIGSLRAFQGRASEALAAMRRARELEPMTLLFNSNYGHVLYHQRRFDEAIAHVRPLLEATPSLDQARSVLIRALVAKGAIPEALEQLGRRHQDRPNVSDAGLVYAHAGQRGDALRELARLRAMSAEGFGIGYEIAVLEAALGNVAGGCEALALAERDASPFLGWMRLDPRMDPLRGQPCFTAIEARLGRGTSSPQSAAPQDLAR